VLLKPNLNGSQCVTNIALVEALIQILYDYNIKRIFIGESSFGNYKITENFFKETGYRALAEKYGLAIKNFNRAETTELKVKNPRILDKIPIARDALEADKIINIPVMKVHYATGITLCLKNMKGLLSPEYKKHFHEVGLDNAIVDLNNSIKSHLNIVDGSYCMEKMGPHGGDVFNLGLILAGQNSWEVDYIGSQIMCYSLEEVKHLKYYLESNNIGYDSLNNIEVLGEKIENVKYPFKKAVMTRIIPDKIRLHNIDACSSCMNAFLISCKLLDMEIKKEVDIIMGTKSINDELNPDKIQIAFGNCCKTGKPANKIRGCPPYPFKLKELLGKLNG